MPIKIDNDLVDQTQKIGGFKTKKETVNAALAEYIRQHQQMEIAKHFGKIDYDEEYNYKIGKQRYYE
jgi:Arc/MetJ family transcription regulator